MFLLWKNSGNCVGGHQAMLNSGEKKIDGGLNHSISSSCPMSPLTFCDEIQIQIHINTKQIQDLLNSGEED